MWPASGYGYSATSEMSQPVVSAAGALPPHIAQNQRNDVFVGNLAFGTTEDQLYQAFSDLGRIIKVRMVSDESGKPRGFAFIEFEDPSAALSAIRNMNDYEINGRRIRVNFSNSSHLESLAGKLGMDLSSQTAANTASAPLSSGTPLVRPAMDGTGSHAVAEALKALSKADSYDIVEKLKAIADRDPDEARKIISAHPQLPEAILFLMSRLDMIQTPMSTNVLDLTSGGGLPMKPTSTMNLTNISAPMLVSPMPAVAAAATNIATASAAGVSTARPLDPRARVDPRAAPIAVSATVSTSAIPPRVDPRMSTARQTATSAVSTAPPSMSAASLTSSQPLFNPYMMAPPPAVSTMAPPSIVPTPSTTTPTSWIMAAQVLGLDLNLVQQVMALTPQQIGQLPPDKQQSILALRQQITNAMQQQQQSFLQKGL